MKKLFIKLQTPTTELKVTAKDAAGVADSILVGFKRYEVKEAELKLKEFQEALQSQVDDSTEGSFAIEQVDAFISSQIVYIKQVRLEEQGDDGRTNSITIADTRKAKPYDTFWENPEECLDALLSMFLAASPWRVPLVTGLQKALVNADFEEDKVKN